MTVRQNINAGIAVSGPAYLKTRPAKARKIGGETRLRTALANGSLELVGCALFRRGVPSALVVKRVLRILAVVVALGALGLWAVKGANCGWTRTNIQHDTPDPVTGLIGVSYEKGFVPGLDFLGGAGLVAAVLAGVSLLIKNKNAAK
jgi:hypothetical protein